MGNIGGGEILVILLVALIVLGPDKLPDVARQVGRAVGEMRKISAGFQRELEDAMRVPDDPKPEPAGPAEPPAAPTDTFLTTEPAALSDPTEPIDQAALVQSAEAAHPNGSGELAPGDPMNPAAADEFLTTEPAALEEPMSDPVTPTTPRPDVVTPPEAPPLPTDAALGGDR